MKDSFGFWAVVLVLILAGYGVFHVVKKRSDEKEAARIAYQMQQEEVRIQKEKEEYERVRRERMEAEKKRQEEAARAREEAEQRRLAEKRAAEEKAAAEAKEAEEREKAEQEAKEKAEQEAKEAIKKQYVAVLDRFKGRSLRPLESMSASEKSDMNKGEKILHYVFPDDAGGCIVFEVKTVYGRPSSVKRLDVVKVENGTWDFDRFMESSPYLVLIGKKVYFRPPQTERESFCLPDEGEVFNPAKEHLGALYDVAAILGLKAGAFVYGVYYRSDAMQKDIPIAKVSLGETIPNSLFRERLMDWNRRQASRPKRRNTGKKLKRTVVFVDGDTVRKRIDGVTEVPREFRYHGNRHRYYWSSREYENEVRKEENARRKWEVLAAEARRQEELAQGLGEGRENNARFVDVDGSGSVVYRILDERADK